MFIAASVIIAQTGSIQWVKERPHGKSSEWSLVSNKKIQTTDICNSAGDSQNHYVNEKYQTHTKLCTGPFHSYKNKKCKIHV